MGMNLHTACHRCKVKVFHLRRKENETIFPFYRKHASCMGIDAKNVETLADEFQDAEWMDEYEEEENLS